MFSNLQTVSFTFNRASLTMNYQMQNPEAELTQNSLLYVNTLVQFGIPLQPGPGDFVGV